LRCPRCGNDNPDSNRFCGMCGATLRPTQVSAPVQTATQAAAQIPTAPPISRPAPAPSPATPVQTVTASRPAPSATEERTTSISGPSFLGLNDPAPQQKRSSLSITQGHDSSSRNLDYLLDDEEPPRSSAWKMLVIIAVLAVVAAVGYMRWKNPSLGTLFSRVGKPAPATQPSEPPDSSATDTSAGTATTPSPVPPSSAPADTTPAPANNAAPDKRATPDKTVAADKTPPAETPAASTPAPDDTAAAHPVAPPAKPKHRAEPDPNLAPPVTARKSVPPDTSAQFSNSVAEAQKYIYGKGVQQDCDHGLRILKPAADHANPKAMIEMGALYSAGLCTPHDLPTAYRWFALALRKEPDNQSVQTDLQKLWGEMTQPERQLAIKLSQ
jgi:hypothetical protein